MRSAEQLQPYSLVFPAEVSLKQVVRWLQMLSGLLHTGPHRLWQRPTSIACELLATEHGLAHRLRVPAGCAAYVVGGLRALLPGIRVTPEEAVAMPPWTRVVELGMRRLDRTLRTPEPEALATSLLASVQVGVEEAVLLQWSITPALPQRPPARQRQAAYGRRGFDAGWGSVEPDSDALADQRAKLAEGNLLAVLRVASRAATEQRAGQLLLPLRAALMSTRTPDNAFYKRLVPERQLRRRLAAGRPSMLFPLRLAATELAGLLSWPLSTPHATPNVAGLPQTRSRHLAPTGAIPRTGRVIGQSNFPGAERPLAVSTRNARSHLHAIGPTDAGKTTLLTNLLCQDMQRGDGAVLLESKGDLYEAAMARIPDSRVEDVIVMDVSDTRYPVAFNLMEEGQPRVVVEELCRLFEYLYPDMHRGIWARAALHRGLSTLVTRQGATFIDLVPLLSHAARSDTETAWRDELIAEVTDPELKRFWTRFAAFAPSQQESWAAPILDRVWQLNERPEVRNIIGQSHSSFHLRDVLRERKILLINLAGLGQETASLTGTLLMNALWSAVRTGASKSHTTYLFLDEFQDYLKLPIAPDEMLAKSRSFGLAMNLSNQHLKQLHANYDLQSAVLANTRSKVVFQTSAEDSRTYAREFGRQVSEEDFLRLGRFEIIARLATDEGVSGPVSGVTFPMPPETGNAAAVRQRSRQRYGTPIAAVEADIRKRRQPRRPPKPRPRLG